MNLNSLLPALLLVATTSVASHAYAFNLPPDMTTPENQVLFTPPSHIPPPAAVQSKILEQFSRWKGTPYHFGGHSHRGIDCSALMQEIFRGAVSMGLPRTTGEQIHRGFHIAKGGLKPGDLVFFKTSPKTRHVGVYVGNNSFIHASKLKGVTISSLDNSFWQAHYETSRRILADA